MHPIHRAALAAALLLPAGLHAQDLPQTNAVLPEPTPTPTPTASPTVAPPPLPVATPTPAPAATPSPRTTPSPLPLPSPTARATPTDVAPAVPPPLPEPAPTPSASPTPAAPAAITAPLPTTEPGQGDRPLWPWALGGALVLLGAIGLWVARRGRSPEEEAVEEEALAAPIAEPRATPRLALAFRPTRAGFNMLSATVEGELEIANTGDVAATDMRVRTALLSAHVGQAAELDAFHADPAGRLAAPPFALQPGERRTLRLVAAAPREALRTMTAGGRPMFVPIFAIDVRTGGGGQVAQAFAVGVERVDSAKLAPFWLDVPPRTYAEVAARPHGPAIERLG